jgi:hypothetical protein
VRVSTVDDDVSLLEERLELGDEVVDSGSGLDEENDLPRRLELEAELLDGLRTQDGLACTIGERIQSSARARGGTEGRRDRPLASLARKWSTLETVRLYATTVKPLSALQSFTHYQCLSGRAHHLPVALGRAQGVERNVGQMGTDMLRIKFWPMTAKPMSPISAL